MERLKKKSPTFNADLECRSCGKMAKRTGPVQLYCAPCSTEKAKLRGKNWSHKNAPRLLSQVRKNGLSNSNRGTRLFDFTHIPDLAWAVKISIPFTQAGSKNHVFTNRPEGHLFFRKQQNDFKTLIAERVAKSSIGIKKVQNKVWISIFIQKTHHKGDAINFVDSICDAVKVGLNIDDRWFCIRSVDWEIVKTNPLIFITVGQEGVPNVQACSYCGRLLEFSNFMRSKSMKHGIGRECRECASSVCRQ